jgi:pyridoxamine 5'-phosphate oxidase family protein
MVFTDAELTYLHSQRLGRLATLAPDGTLQNSPVGFDVDDEAGVISIYGRDLGNTRKFHNVAANGKAAFVVDDIVSFDPWTVRCLEVRGVGQALTQQAPPNSYMSSEVICIHPRRIISWGMGRRGQQGSKRNVGQSPHGSTRPRR